ncbi:hypothetical protein C4573_07275 [Candidatus Woesearchaeota archaeon]|nr:MAG: hypothetical protein C4573_07275 [Candidatus Woesearchaeota archaeon]
MGVNIPRTEIADVVEKVIERSATWGMHFIATKEIKCALKPLNTRYSPLAARHQKIAQETLQKAYEYLLFKGYIGARESGIFAYAPGQGFVPAQDI